MAAGAIGRHDALTADRHVDVGHGAKSPDHAALWQVLRDASDSLREASAGPAPANADHPAATLAHSFVASALFAAVVPRPYPALSTASLCAALERIRRAFLARVAAMKTPPDVRSVLHVLEATDRVYDALGTDEMRNMRSRFEAPDALSLVVELAHDMRSPLTSILFLVETLRQQQRDEQANAAAARQLGIVYSAAFNLSSLVSDVVDLAQDGTRLLERDAVPLSIAEMMRSVQEMVQPIAEAKNLPLRFTQSADDVRVGQPLALCRVLLNLTTNALKFTSMGEVAISALAVGDRTVRFEVSDTGRGIPPSQLASLFDPSLTRAPASGREAGLSRTRLGLAMCDALVRMMGSRLYVRSVVGGGACFFFELDMPLPAAGQPITPPPFAFACAPEHHAT